jgi:hypothetical protein
MKPSPENKPEISKNPLDGPQVSSIPDVPTRKKLQKSREPKNFLIFFYQKVINEIILENIFIFFAKLNFWKYYQMKRKNHRDIESNIWKQMNLPMMFQAKVLLPVENISPPKVFSMSSSTSLSPHRLPSPVREIRPDYYSTSWNLSGSRDIHDLIGSPVYSHSRSNLMIRPTVSTDSQPFHSNQRRTIGQRKDIALVSRSKSVTFSSDTQSEGKYQEQSSPMDFTLDKTHFFGKDYLNASKSDDPFIYLQQLQDFVIQVDPDNLSPRNSDKKVNQSLTSSSKEYAVFDMSTDENDSNKHALSKSFLNLDSIPLEIRRLLVNRSHVDEKSSDLKDLNIHEEKVDINTIVNPGSKPWVQRYLDRDLLNVPASTNPPASLSLSSKPSDRHKRKRNPRSLSSRFTQNHFILTSIDSFLQQLIILLLQKQYSRERISILEEKKFFEEMSALIVLSNYNWIILKQDLIDVFTKLPLNTTDTEEIKTNDEIFSLWQHFQPAGFHLQENELNEIVSDFHRWMRIHTAESKFNYFNFHEFCYWLIPKLSFMIKNLYIIRNVLD